MSSGEMLAFGAISVVAVGGIIWGLVQRYYRRGKGERLPFVKFWNSDMVPVAVIPDSGIEPEIRAMMQRAINWWNEELGFRAFHDIGTIPDDSGLRVPLKLHVGEYDNGEAIAYASIYTTTGQISSAAIYLVESKLHSLSWHAMAHELGHVLGLDHDEEKESVMYKRHQSEAPKLSKIDRELLRDVYFNH